MNEIVILDKRDYQAANAEDDEDIYIVDHEMPIVQR